MRCPKCGADASGDECPSCGLIFAKWQPIPARVPSSSPAPVQQTMSIWIPITAVVIFLALGIMWTASRRAAREKEDPSPSLDAQVNAINASAPTSRELSPVVRATNVWPRDLPESKARAMLEQCSAFQQPFTDELPRAIAIDAMPSPELAEAERAGIVEIEEARENVRWIRLTPEAYAKTKVVDNGEAYVFEHGARRITKLELVRMHASTAHVRFQSKFENSSVTFGRETRGEAQLVQKNGAWEIESATLGEGANKRDACR